MSRLFAEYLMNINGVDRDSLVSVLGSGNIYGKYLSNKKMIEFRVLDFYSYLSDPSNPFFFNVQIDEGDLLRMLKIDTYSDDEKNELYYHKLLTTYEQMELDDDVFWGISILQYFFHISKRTIVEMKKANHLFKLYKIPSKKVFLSPRQLHSKGGRPLGSLTEMTEADLQNLENAEQIIANCVSKDRFVEYMELSRLLVRNHYRNETGVLLTMTGAKWKFYILRYKYKLEMNYKEHDTEYERTLMGKNEQYKIFSKLEF